MPCSPLLQLARIRKQWYNAHVHNIRTITFLPRSFLSEDSFSDRFLRRCSAALLGVGLLFSFFLPSSKLILLKTLYYFIYVRVIFMRNGWKYENTINGYVFSFTVLHFFRVASGSKIFFPADFFLPSANFLLHLDFKNMMTTCMYLCFSCRSTFHRQRIFAFSMIS